MNTKNIVDCSGVGTMLAYTDNAALVEVRDGGPRDSVEFWREVLADAAAGALPPALPSDFTWYHFAADLTRAQQQEYGLPEDLETYQPIDHPKLAADLGFEGQLLYPLAWSRGNPDYAGELAVRIAVPDVQLVG